MDIRHNNLFYRAINKSNVTKSLSSDLRFELDDLTPPTASTKILLCAYKTLVQRFNQLNIGLQKEWQPEINIMARQLSELFKQAAKTNSYSGYPALSLLKEIRQLDEKIINNMQGLLEPSN